MKKNMIQYIMMLSLLFGIHSALFAQEEPEAQEDRETITNSSQWELHAGVGLNIGVNGLPSQVANQLAVNEGYLSDVSEMRGLPIGMAIFGGFGYRFNETAHSMGLELGIGFHTDGGRARVTLGDDPNNIPGYVFDGTVGALGPDNTGLAFDQIGDIYKGLSTVNTMKGHYLDPKLRLYYRYRQPKWSVQSGLGVAMLIPLNYFAYPSKIRSDYQLDNEQAEGLFDLGWASNMSQGAITSARIPFPLAMRDGTVMMRPFQPLADLHLRFTYRNYYFDVSYATEFRFIHHVKIGMGIHFM